MTDIEHSGFSEFDRWLALAKRTRELLDAAVGDGALPDGGGAYLADRTLPHVESVQAGFLGWLRSDAAGVDELRYLLGRVAAIRVEAPTSDAERRAADAEAAAEQILASRHGRPSAELRVAEPWSLAALAHARVVLAMLPRIADADVRYPAGRRTYADIAAPRGPAELSRPPRGARAISVADGRRTPAGPRRPGVPASLWLLRCGRPARSARVRDRCLALGSGGVTASPRCADGRSDRPLPPAHRRGGDTRSSRGSPPAPRCRNGLAADPALSSPRPSPARSPSPGRTAAPASAA